MWFMHRITKANHNKLEFNCLITPPTHCILSPSSVCLSNATRDLLLSRLVKACCQKRAVSRDLHNPTRELLWRCIDIFLHFASFLYNRTGNFVEIKTFEWELNILTWWSINILSNDDLLISVYDINLFYRNYSWWYVKGWISNKETTEN